MFKSTFSLEDSFSFFFDGCHKTISIYPLEKKVEFPFLRNESVRPTSPTTINLPLSFHVLYDMNGTNTRYAIPHYLELASYPFDPGSLRLVLFKILS